MHSAPDDPPWKATTPEDRNKSQTAVSPNARLQTEERHQDAAIAPIQLNLGFRPETPPNHRGSEGCRHTSTTPPRRGTTPIGVAAVGTAKAGCIFIRVVAQHPRYPVDWGSKLAEHNAAAASPHHWNHSLAVHQRQAKPKRSHLLPPALTGCSLQTTNRTYQAVQCSVRPLLADGGARHLSPGTQIGPIWTQLGAPRLHHPLRRQRRRGAPSHARGAQQPAAAPGNSSLDALQGRRRQRLDPRRRPSPRRRDHCAPSPLPPLPGNSSPHLSVSQPRYGELLHSTHPSPLRRPGDISSRARGTRRGRADPARRLRRPGAAGRGRHCRRRWR